MRLKGVKLIALSLMLAMMLGGCGTKLYTMTDSERDLVVKSAAYIVARNNVYQKDGAVKVSKARLRAALADDTETTDEQETVTDNEAVSVEGFPTDSTETAENIVQTVSLVDAVGLTNLATINYNGFSVTNNYKEGDFYSLDSDKGKVFIVTSFMLTNISASDLNVDMVSLAPKFTLSIDGGANWISQEVTLLLCDLSSYTGTVKAGGQKELVLLFEVSEEDAAAVTDNVKIAISMNDVTSQLNLQ